MPAGQYLRIHGNRCDISGRAGSRIGHIHSRAADLLEGNAITWVSRCGNECLNLPEVEDDRLVDLRIRIGVHDHRFRLHTGEAAILRQIPDQRFCRFHNGGQRVAFDRHIGQDGLLLEGEFSRAPVRRIP